MRALTEAEFLSWSAERGLHLDPQYPNLAVLSFRNDGGDARFWEIPEKPERRSYFLASLLELLGEWQSCFAWRHLGSWPAADRLDPQRINDLVEYEILSGIGLPMGTGSVVEFVRMDCPALVTLLFSTTIFGWSVGEDLYLVPDHARYVLQTDHHNVVHIEFRDANDVEGWVTEMAKRGFPLPEELPDETFKQPDWMPRHEH
jgi:hypothetical protein